MALRLTLVIALAIAALTLTPPGAPQPGMPGFDKLVHMLAFAVLAMPMAYARRLAVWQVVLASLAFGGMIELAGRGSRHGSDAGAWCKRICFNVGRACRNLEKISIRFL